VSKWVQDELPFETPPDLLQKVRAATVDKPQYRCGFTVLVQHDGEFVVKMLYPNDPSNSPVERFPNPTEVERAARAVSDFERERILAQRVADLLQPRDVTQEALRKKAQERGVI
jgi:hypothetical protein